MKVRKTIAALATASVVTATGVLSASPASAARDDCPDREVICLWVEPGFGDEDPSSFARPVPDLRDDYPWLNDNVGSVWNRTNQRWCLYQDPSYGGITQPVEPDGHISNLLTKNLKRRTTSLRPRPDGRC